MTGKQTHKQARLSRVRVTETWYQRQERERQRDLWMLVGALVVSALALSVLR